MAVLLDHKVFVLDPATFACRELADVPRCTYALAAVDDKLFALSERARVAGVFEITHAPRLLGAVAMHEPDEGGRALAFDGESPVVVSSHAVYFAGQGSRWRRLPLELPHAARTAIAVTVPGFVFVGWEGGEFGGELASIRIDDLHIRTEATSDVVGLKVDPVRPGCVVAALASKWEPRTTISRSCRDSRGDRNEALEVIDGPPPHLEIGADGLVIAERGTVVWNSGVVRGHCGGADVREHDDGGIEIGATVFLPPGGARTQGPD